MKLSLPENSRMLEKDFTFGVATASFQIEGGIDHRQPCIWDTFCAKSGTIADKSDGSVACNHFNLWQQDVQLIADMGVDAYRLSIAWGRVLNEDGSKNSAGVEFYRNLLRGLKTKNIKTFVTLYHWDLPQHLEDNGGWLNRQTAYAFRDYADLISRELGDLVDSWATLNEPFCSSYLGYEAGIHAPGKGQQSYGRKSAHHLLLAHGLAMQVLQKNCPDSMNGIVLNFTPGYSVSDSAEDMQATAYANDYFNWWYSRPIFEGKYPDIIDSFDDSIKPDIESGDMEIIATPIDFLGVNFYTRAVYKAHPTSIFEEIPPSDVPLTDMGWEIYPQAFTQLLSELHSRYSLPPIYITENGAAMPDQLTAGVVNDLGRIQYYQDHMNAVNAAIDVGVNVQGYFGWSLMDNFEWALGYTKRFGLVYVDYDTQQRYVKESGKAYTKLITSRS
ncbi:GH1 family beta-glucosidase [Thalassotalea sp. PS06]|uniref:GH1 family beta-glucosidase n=1 Tax=Thalassotalea sp. PS06 TaxID=2594005 RepID=UPI00116400D7|nr:GH1 family beta-glucosidase [Thalassotalea sp. PS06]QDP00459.1 beta-glucosidase [Thalassotalea sp. PS06]